MALFYQMVDPQDDPEWRTPGRQGRPGVEDQQERPAGLSGVPVLTGTPIYLAIVSKKEINASFCSLVSLVI